jgi:hypothetical protein
MFPAFTIHQMTDIKHRILVSVRVAVAPECARSNSMARLGAASAIRQGTV